VIGLTRSLRVEIHQQKDTWQLAESAPGSSGRLTQRLGLTCRVLTFSLRICASRKRLDALLGNSYPGDACTYTLNLPS